MKLETSSIHASDDVAGSGEGLSRRLANRYLFVLTAVAALVVVDQLIIQPLMVRMSWYAPVINMAGRQRMLSQKLTKAALSLEAAEDDIERRVHRNELHRTLAQWSNAHSMLRYGSSDLAIQKIHSARIEAVWNQLAPNFNAMSNAAEQILRGETDMTSATPSTATKTIVHHEAAFLQAMERIVQLMEDEAANVLLRLRLCAATIAVSVVALLLGLGWFVIRPATDTIRRQVENLESRVALRNRELSTALEALRREVARRQQSDFKMQRLATQLAHAERVWTMNHLTAGLAHELNHPLATIANYAEACDVRLKRFEEEDRVVELRNYLDKTKHASLRAGEIVRRMRNFIRPNTPISTEVEIDSLIRDVLELCRYEIDQSGSQVSMQLARDRCTVTVDPIQIQQVLVNLIQNALQAMHNCRSDERRISIASTVLIDSVQVEVSDSGPGFKATDSDSVFQPFYTTKSDGLGIGLAICRTIVEQHGGSIWATAASCDGARVAFTLPHTDNDARLRQTQYECVCR